MPVGEMMTRMSAWEFGAWQALAIVEHEEHLLRQSQAEADAMAQNARRNRRR